MTVDTQMLRELHSKSTQGEWRQVNDMPYLHAFAPDQQTKNHWEVPCVGRFYYDTGNTEFIAAAHNHFPAILDEIDRLRAELQERQWHPIETAPADTDILLGYLSWQDKWVCEVGMAHCTRGRWWHGQGTHWMPLPPAPPQGETA